MTHAACRNLRLNIISATAAVQQSLTRVRGPSLPSSGGGRFWWGSLVSRGCNETMDFSPALSSSAKLLLMNRPGMHMHLHSSNLLLATMATRSLGFIAWFADCGSRLGFRNEEVYLTYTLARTHSHGFSRPRAVTQRKQMLRNRPIRFFPRLKYKFVVDEFRPGILRLRQEGRQTSLMSRWSHRVTIYCIRNTNSNNTSHLTLSTNSLNNLHSTYLAKIAIRSFSFLIKKHLLFYF